MAGDPLLTVTNLETEFRTDRGDVQAVNDVSFEIHEGESYGFVGESGAGKTVTGLSVLGLIERPGRITGGEVLFKGRDLRSLSDEELRSVRGNEISMIFQDPMTAMNPAYTIGTQLVDTICEHMDLTRTEARERAIGLLDDVGIPDPGARIDDYPHQYSGGMLQRAVIAMAVSCDPDLIIADEPTSALDVTTQAQILDLLDDLQDEYDLALQFITHNMGVIKRICDRMSVMYAGEIVESGTVDQVFDTPRHPYTVGLMNAIPRLDDPRDRLESLEGTMPELIDTPSGCSFRTRCPHATEECASTHPPLVEVDGTADPTAGWSDASHTSACIRIDEIDFDGDVVSTAEGRTSRTEPAPSSEPLVEADSLRKYFDPESQSWFQKYLGDRQYVQAVDDVSMTIRRGETVGLVGESGCGKTTLGRVLAQLYEPDEGRVVFAGTDLTEAGRKEVRAARSDMQVIFQNPFSSLNPRRTVKEIIARPMEIHGVVDGPEEKERRVTQLLDDVGLPTNVLDRYPHAFSGGQKQRIGIARALAVNPDFIVADEPVSALDVSVQAKILNLLMDLQDEYGLTYLFIAHDLNVVQHIADRVAVMYLGEIVESGTVQEVFEPPYHPYTEVLLSAIPALEDREVVPEKVEARGEPPSPIDPPSGCRFHTRCPYAMPECETREPETIHESETHGIHCHLYDEAVMADKSPSDLPAQPEPAVETGEND